MVAIYTWLSHYDFIFSHFNQIMKKAMCTEQRTLNRLASSLASKMFASSDYPYASNLPYLYNTNSDSISIPSFETNSTYYLCLDCWTYSNSRAHWTIQIADQWPLQQFKSDHNMFYTVNISSEYKKLILISRNRIKTNGTGIYCLLWSGHLKMSASFSRWISYQPRKETLASQNAHHM
jgi:hypothetical protein